ncbi:ABC transporter permease [Rothia kristinae]
MSAPEQAAAAPAAARRIHAPSSWPRAGMVALICAVVVTIIVLAFTWPTKTQEAKDLPITVAGPQERVQQLEDTLEQARPGVFDFHEAADRDDAEQQIRRQETVGAIVFSDDAQQPPEILKATAAGTVPAQLMTALGEQLQSQIRAGLQQRADAAQQQLQASGAQASPQQIQQAVGLQKAAATTTVTVTDVVGLSDEDPNGAGFTAASFPLVLGGIIGGVLVNTMVHGLWRRLFAAGAYAVIAGLSLTLILHTWFGFVQGDFLVDWMVFVLSVLGTSSFILGCTALIGNAGIGLGAVITMFLGNPLSGAQVPWQFYPHPWGWIGQHLVPGAAQHLLRSESFFPDADTAEQWWTLNFWALLGVALTVVGYLVHHHGKTSDVAEEQWEEAHEGGVRGAEPVSGAASQAGAATAAPRHRAAG